METHRLALPPGYRIESYEIVRMLGKGGFGITYQARDVQIGRLVAIKELLPDSIATRVEGSTVVPQSEAHEESWQWARERFIDEARILAGFRHPNIIAVHRIVEANGTVYLIMDCIEGESYEARLRRIGRESDEASLRAVIEPLLDGLQEVHASGLLHRDIKPENILFDKRGHPILIDFGAARSSVGATTTMTSIVTHGYSPIEQYQTKGKMGPWTDIYAVGALMYRAITGEKPPVAADRVGADCYVSLLSYPSLPGFSRSLLQAVDSSLAIFGEQRPQCVARWLVALDGTRPDAAVPFDRCAGLASGESPTSPAPNIPPRHTTEKNFHVVCPHCNWKTMLETSAQSAFECASCGGTFEARPTMNISEEVEEVCYGEETSGVSGGHALSPLFARYAPWVIGSMAVLGLLFMGVLWFQATGQVEEKMAANRAEYLAAEARTRAEQEKVAKASQVVVSTPQPAIPDSKKQWIESQLSRLEALKRSQEQSRQDQENYQQRQQQQKVLAQEAAAKLQKERDERALLVAQENARLEPFKKAEREQAVRIASQKLQQETDAWNLLISSATAQNPFVNSAGMRFIRVSGTDYLIAVSPVNRSTFDLSRGLGKSSADSPAIVSWKDAVDFCNWLSMGEGRNYHLPSEMEWQKAIQSGTVSDGGSLWSWCADAMDSSANLIGGGDGKILLGKASKPAYRQQRYDNVGFRCILAPRQ